MIPSPSKSQIRGFMNHSDSYSGTEARASTSTSSYKYNYMYMKCREEIKVRMKDRWVMAATTADQIPDEVNE